MSYAAQLRAVRAYYGFSQPALAHWLGLGRAQVASVETGREPLPAHARPWLRPWVEALALPDPAPVAGPAPAAAVLAPLAAGPALVRARVAECQYQAQRLGQQLAALQAAHRIAVRRRAAGPLLRAALAAPTPAEATALALRRRWLARLLEEAADALAPEAAGGPVAAQLLEARQQALLHEAAWLRAGL